MSEARSTLYKVVELQTVADDTLEELLNTWSSQGWDFDGLHFVPNESSKRPKMAFVIFTRPMGETDSSGEEA